MGWFTGGGMPGVFSTFEWVDLPPLFLLPLVAEFLCFTRLPAENLSRFPGEGAVTLACFLTSPQTLVCFSESSPVTGPTLMASLGRMHKHVTAEWVEA